MTYKIDDLADCVNRDDAFSFLLVYLNLIVQGLALSLPQESSVKAVKSEWPAIMPISCQNHSSDFINQLSEHWVNLVDSHSGKMTDFFVSELLDLLLSKPQSKSLKTLGKNGPLIGMDPKLNAVKSSISDEYEVEQKIYADEKVGETDFFDQIIVFYKHTDHISFLNYYLEFCIQKNDFNFPKSSVLETIEEQWAVIFTKLYDKKADNTFLKEISYTWFHLLNKFSVPYTKEALENILFDFQKQYFSQIKKLNINISD